MAGDGTTYQIDLPVSGTPGVNAGADALDRLTKNLTSAAAASTQAADAVKAGEASYKAAESAADRAAKSLEKIGMAADAQRGKMKAAMDAGDPSAFWRAAAAAEKLNVAQSAAAAKAAATAAAVKTEAAALDKLKAAADAAKTKEDDLSKTQSAAKKAADELKKTEAAAQGSGSISSFAMGLKKLGGPLGQIGGVVGPVAKGMDKLTGSVGAVAGISVGAAVAIIALTAALIAGAAAIVHWGVSNADAARSTSLLSAGIATTVKGGQQLDDAIHSLGATLPQSREELTSMAADLAKTGLRGQALTDALAKTATQAAKLKYGPEFAKETLSLTNQAARLRDNISGPKGIFSGLKIEGLLTAISRLVAMFDATSITGRAIKVVFESMFQPLVDGLTALGPKIVSTFIQFEIWVLRALIAIKPFGSTIVTVAKWVGVGAAIIGAALVIAVAVIVAVTAATLALVAAGFYFVNWITAAAKATTEFAISVGSGIGDAFNSIVTTIKGVIDYLSSLSLAEIGQQLIQGLINGIIPGGPAVVNAIKGVVGGAIDSAKSLLKISSPSKVFAEIGAYTSAGMAQGVDSGAGDVQSSLESMVAPPEPEKAAAAGAAGKGGGASLAGATFNFYGVEGVEGAVARFQEGVLSVLEGAAVQAGSEVPA